MKNADHDPPIEKARDFHRELAVKGFKTKQSQNMIELALKPFLDKIKDLNNHLLCE
jgi:uncharacterized LabA/DUF88 family protein